MPQSVYTQTEVDGLISGINTKITDLTARVTKLETATPVTPPPTTSTTKLYAPMFMWVGPAWDAHCPQTKVS